MTENGTCADGIARSDQEAWERSKRHHDAGQWHVWCADCGSKNHKNASECQRCEYGDGPGSFGVGNKLNVGRAKYTSDGERGVYERSLHTETQQGESGQ